MANPAMDLIAAKVNLIFLSYLQFACTHDFWQRAHERYLDMDPTFQDTRECQLIAKLLQVGS